MNLDSVNVGTSLVHPSAESTTTPNVDLDLDLVNVDTSLVQLFTTSMANLNVDSGSIETSLIYVKK